MARRTKRRYRGRMAAQFSNRVRRAGTAWFSLQAESSGFRGCVTIKNTVAARGNRTFCGTGKNPRKALASALKFAGRMIGQRRGAFAGR